MRRNINPTGKRNIMPAEKKSIKRTIDNLNFSRDSDSKKS